MEIFRSERLLTDGLIQQVFRSYFLRHHTFKDMYESRKDYIPLDELAKIEQELIEKIKQELLESGYHIHENGLIARLIGDSKE